MISKVKYIKNIGKFYDFATKGEGLDWGRNTFVFAPNAYGKSTLVNVFQSLRDNDPKLIQGRRTLGTIEAPKAVIIIDGVNHTFRETSWDKACPTIQIFDAPFIYQNILSHEIAHEHRKNIHKIIIGAKGIKLADELAVLKNREKDNRQRLGDLEAAFRAARFGHFQLDPFLAISSSEETIVGERIRKLEQRIKSKESEGQIRVLSGPTALSAPTIDLSAAKSLACQKLADVHQVAERRVTEHITQHSKDREQAIVFIRQGLDLMEANCPFCGQDLENAADLLMAYREFFDEAFRTYGSSVSQQIQTLNDWNLNNDLTGIVASHNANMTALKQWEPFIPGETLPDVATTVESARVKVGKLKQKVNAELTKKQNNPNANSSAVPFDDLAAELASLRAVIDSYNNVVASFTEKTRKYVRDLPTSDLAALRIELAKDQEVQKRFTEEWKAWATNHCASKDDFEKVAARKNAKQRELEDYTKDIFDAYQVRINELLLTLGVDFRITKLTGKTDDRANEAYSEFGFLILEREVPLTAHLDDAPSFKNTLSEGDKSTLAFAFFIAALEQRPQLDEQIVVLDDPLSSLDETRREATARVLLELSPKLDQLCVFTHKKDFLGMLFDKITENTVLQIRSDNTNGSRLEPFDLEEDRKSDYVRMVEDMQRYVTEDFGPTPDTMQGNIRRVFEVVLKTKYYHALAEDIRAKKGFAQLLETLFAKELLDPVLQPKLFDICNVSNGPHHGEIVDTPSRKLTRDELVPLIQDALGLIEKL